MKYIKHIPLVLLVFCACKNQNTSKGFVLNGTVIGDIPKMIFLEYGNTLDSALVINNKFKFQGKVPEFSEATLRTHGASALMEDFIYLENSEIVIDLTIEKLKYGETEVNFIKVDTIIGTETARIRSNFEKWLLEFEGQPNNKDALFRKINEIIAENPSNQYSSYLLSSYSNKFTIEEVKSLFSLLDTTYISTSRLEDLKRIIQPSRNLIVGSQLADFSLNDINGLPIDTKEFRNKIVLIDFWASWCGPCRKKHPQLKDLYKKYNSKDFEILGVSIDTEIDKWEKALEKDNLPWLNVIEDKGFNGEVASRYNIVALPTTFLIDKNGEITHRDISIEDLENFLSEL